MSDTPTVVELRQHLADTEVGPSELRDLLVLHHADDDAVKVLCDHAKQAVPLRDGSFPLLAALFAAREQVMCASETQAELEESADDFEWETSSWLEDQFNGATGTALREFFRTARAAFPGEYEFLFRTITGWFIEYVPLPILTDDVVADMTIWETPTPSPELGAGWPPENDETEDVGSWLLSRHLCNRFGEHGPSWEMFMNLYDPQSLSIGEAADQVEELRKRFGEHGPSWDLLVMLHDSQGFSISEAADKVEELRKRFGKHGPSWDLLVKLPDSQGFSISEAADKVAELRKQFGTRSGPWTMLMGIYDDGSQTIDEVAEMVVAVEHG